jgi:tetratricopeptide (TPR) repeat protein
MADPHIAEDLLERFLRNEASREEVGHIVQHLVSACQECSELAHRLSATLGTPSEAYEEAFTRACAFVSKQKERLALEKLRGWAQWASLKPASPEARSALVVSDPRYHTFGLYERLLEASRSYIRTDPAEAVDIVRLAITVVERLDPAVLGEDRVADLRAGAWGALANASRLAADFEGSRRALNEAWRILEEEGTNDPLERAHLIGLESGYIQDMGEFETAESSLEEALKIYRRLGDRHLQGRTLLKMGDCIGQVDPERGIARIDQALPLINVKTEPRLKLCAQHDLAWFLNESGRPEEALAVLDRARPLYQQFSDPWTQLRLHWLEGRIASRLGDLPEAEAIFGHLWDDFRSRSLHHEAVLVSIDLAEVLVRQGDCNRAAELVEECYPLMKTWGLHRYALAAWIVFQEALAQGRVEGMFGRVREYFLRCWVRAAVFE